MLGYSWLKDILSENQVNNFLYEIDKKLPNFEAAVITDRNGFPIASRIRNRYYGIKENELALSAISPNSQFLDDSRFLKIKKNLDKSNNIKLFLILEKRNKLFNRNKGLKTIVGRQILFWRNFYLKLKKRSNLVEISGIT